MVKHSISEHVAIAKRYVRSIDLARDLDDPNAIEGYVLTAAVRDTVLRMVAGLRAGSSQRAFRITGPYGVGKSSVGLFLAKLFRGDPDALGIAGSLLPAGLGDLPRYEPIVLSGRRASFVSDLLDAVEAAATRLQLDYVRAAAVAARTAENASGAAFDALDALATALDGREGRGVLLFVDEMGRYLEFAASHPRVVDPSVFQTLAERAGGRSAAPLAVVGLLHHRFSEYVAGLGDWIEGEWARTAERYEEIAFRESAEQSLFLLSSALEPLSPSKSVIASAGAAYRDAHTRGLFHTAPSELGSMSKRLFPLHPGAVAVLSVIARRFGQNERSLFGFLQSNEPHGFRDHIDRMEYDADGWYLLPRLFDYINGQGELRLRAPDRERRWQLALDALVQAEALCAIDLEVLKSVALISVLGPIAGLRSDADCLAWCLRCDPGEVQASLDRLAERRILYRRPHRDDFSLWSSSSVDLDHWITEAKVHVPASTRIQTLSGLPASRPLVAHRHYHRTGTLRTFSVTADETGRRNDGAIIVVPFHPDEDEEAVLRDVAARSRHAAPLTLFCVQRVDASDLRWAHELAMWRWISENCDELRVDDLARSEVASRINAAETALGQTLGALARPSVAESTKWFDRGERLHLDGSAGLSRHLSDMLDASFPGAPILRNELINRGRISTAVASARMRLLELMVTSSDEQYLGLEGAPPERTIYLTMFAASGMHRRIGADSFEFARPEPDPMNWSPAWDRIGELVADEGLVRFDELVNALSAQPIGLRAGPALLLIAAFMLANRREIALMERGSFQPELTGAHFMRLAKSPANFALRHLGEADDRRKVLERLASELVIFEDMGRPDIAIKPIVEGIFEWWRGLPAYALSTRNVSSLANDVRAALSKGREPIDLVFVTLPKVCDALLPSGEIEPDILVEKLNSALLELSEAEPILRSMASAALAEAFGVKDVAGVHEQMRASYEPHRAELRDFTLRQFVDRMLAPEGEKRRLDGVSGLLAGRRIEAWTDESLDKFAFEARSIADRLRRWLAAMHKRAARKSDLKTLHVVSTSGEEQMMVVQAGAQRQSSMELEAELRRLLAGRPDAGDILGRLLVERMSTQSEEQDA